MCGIAGFWRQGGDGIDLDAAVRRMTDAIRHRGPDDSGTWVDPVTGLALGHRRLSILDLSPAGHQPMHSAGERFVVSFNGEIYNWQELRAEEERHGARWRGHSDTEIMLAMFERLGVVEATKRFAGMFAFAVWDRKERRLSLARDRLGEKPLYYGWVGTTFLFGSELKALRAGPAWNGQVDRGSVAVFLRHNYVPAPFSIYEGIRKVVPGTIVEFGPVLGHSSERVTTYWSARDVAERGTREPFRGGLEDVLQGLDEVLRLVIRQQMVADVPVGAFLSGGVDSSLIVSLMQAQSTRPVRSFTIGFHEQGYNEAEDAKRVAKHLGTDHTELYVTPQQALDVVPLLPRMYDEPFSDSSQIPTFLVAHMARQQVTVSLSGDGGDELFGGYWRYFFGGKLWRTLAPVPRPVRAVAGAALRALPPTGWDALFRAMAPITPRRHRVRLAGDRVHKLAGILSADSGEALYRRLTSHWPEPELLIPGATEHPSVLTDRRRWAQVGGLVDRMMYLDTVSYLPDDILVKVDRATMAVSLESRAPFLDHRVAEFAWQIPMAMKVRDGVGKWAVRQVLDRYVPRALVDRPKMGFGVPLGDWLRGPLKEWAESLLAPDRLRRDGMFAEGEIRRKWREHLSGSRNWQYLLWDVLMFQSWLETSGD